MKKTLLHVFTVFILAFFAGVKYGCAQLMTNNNVQITVTTGATITANGSIDNRTGTTISNSGAISLTGNWSNNSGNSLFGVSQGVVTFNGVNQTINGTDVTVFNNLNFINGIKTIALNTIAGGGNAIPTGVLNINNAAFNLNANQLTITNPAGGALAFTTGYIISEQTNNSARVLWKINGTTGIHTIPFGNIGGVQIPFTFNLTSGDAGDLTASTYPTAANNTPYPLTPTVVTHVRNSAYLDNSANTVDRFWQVNTTGIDPLANLTFTWAATENAANGNAGPVAQRWVTNSNAWLQPLPGQTNPTLQSVLVPNASAFGPWTISANSVLLPIELLEFDAKAIHNAQVKCYWTTASEINNDYFTVEKSKDGINFESIADVDGAGNSNALLNYHHIDKNPFSGLSYYRLKQTDFNGDFSYSKKVPVTIATKASISVYPQLSHGEVYVLMSENSIAQKMLVLDAQGRLIKNVAPNVQLGLTKIDLTTEASGVYFIHVLGAGSKDVFKVVKLQ
jgi:hypothetical protein